MSTNYFPARIGTRRAVDPIRYVTRRVSSLVVAVGAALGLVSAALFHASGVPMIGGVIVVVFAVIAATALAAALSTRSLDARRVNLVAANEVVMTDSIGNWRWSRAEAMQLGPDYEQVIGRETGSRV